MVRLMLQKKPSLSLIGLDIGQAGVRACQLKRHRGVYTSVHATLRTPTLSLEPGLPSRELIRNCLSQARFRGRSAVSVLNSPDLKYYSLQLPNTDPTTLDHIVRFEMERLLVPTPEPVETQYWLLPATKVEAPNTIGVAVQADTVMEAVSVCDGAGLFCTRVETGATALARLGVLLQSREADQVWGLLDLGSRQTRLVLCVEETPVLVRTVSVGGRSWTERVAEALQISLASAEIQKCDHGIATTSRGLRKEDEKIPPDALGSLLMSILRASLHELTAEIKRSYEYVLGCYPGRRAADLILVGGGAQMRNLPTFLTDKLGISVHRASTYLENESCRLRWNGGVDRSLETFATAVGLAAGE